MGKRGPAPKPTVLRVIEGNRGRRPLNKNEPKPRPITPTCPSHLAAAGRAEWKRIVPELERMGLLTIVDRAALAAYCQAYARWKAAEAKIVETGEVIRQPGTGNYVRNPWLLTAERAMEQVHRYGAEFGLTPAARTRIQVPKGEGEDDWPELD